MMHTRLLRAFVAAFLLMMGMLTLNVAQPVSAASATTTNTVTLEGQSSEQTKLSKQAMCDECMPDDLFICGDGCEVAGGGKISVHTSVSWSAPLQVDTTADAAELSQGNSTDVISTLTPGAGEITINYRIPYQIGLFARNGDFPDGPDWHPTTEYTLVDEFNISTSAPCTPSLAGDGTGTCNVTDSINLLPETCFFALCPVDITVNLLVTHQFDIVGTEIVAHRVTTNAAPADIHYDGASPASETEEIDVPCDGERR